MISHDQQGMSPNRTTVLEGEVNGPSYSTGSLQQNVRQDEATMGSEPAVNGTGVVRNGDQSGCDQATMPPATGVQSIPTTAEFLSASGPVNRDEQGPSVSVRADQGASVVDAGLSQGSVRVHEGGFEFSPPEPFPSENHQQSASSQVMWFTRIGEFVQRRVAQAGAAMNPIMEARAQRASTQVLRTPSPRSSRLFSPDNEQTMAQWTRRAPHLYTPELRAHEESSSASLTQEQILAEVQKQVRAEMKTHHEERQALVQENQQLKDMLEKVLYQMQARGLDGGRDGPRGNLPGPHGGAPDGQSDGRGGNLGGLRQPPAGAAGDLSKAQPAPGLQVPCGGESGDPRRGQEYVRQPGSDPLGASLTSGGKYPGGSGVGEHGHRPAGGVSSQPPVQQAATAGPSGQAAQVLQDPLGALVQGMAQLQNAMSESLSLRTREPEVVKPGLADLPKLAEMGANSAIDIGDWLHGLQNHMGDLSNNSGQWWSEVMQCLTKYYEAYLAASNVGKLTIKAEDYESEFLKDSRWSRVDKRASSMILASVPEAVKSELLSTRLVGSLAMLSRVVVLYRPGSTAERQQVVRALESPSQAASAADAVTELRKWARWMARATDIGLQCPDASVLVRGLDTIVKKVLPEHADIAFRVSMLRYTLEVDTRPTIEGARDLQQALMSELEQVAFRGRSANASVPSVKAAMLAPAPTATTQKGDHGNGAEGGSPNGQPKAKAKPACRFFLTDKGCSKGSGCTFSHAFTRKERMGRCWTCGSMQHHQPECPTRTGGGTSPSARTTASAKAAPSVRAMTDVTPSSATPTSTPVAGATTSTSSTTAEPQTQVAPEGELKVLLQEASAMLKEIRQLKALALSTTQVENRAVGSGCDPRSGRTGLLDSGASHPFREATDTELEEAARVRVQLADGKEVVLAQNSSGTLLTRRSGGDASGPIVPLGALVQDLGCQISWTRRGGLTIRHPEHGLIRPSVIGRCPVVAEHQALDLIYEIECEKLRQLQYATRATAKSIWLWDKEKPWARHLDDFIRVGGRGAQLRAMFSEGSPFSSWSEMDRSLAAEHIDLDDKSGWAYLRALPGSRQRRKRLMSLPWVIHLYAGPDRHVDPIFRELDDGRVLVQIDINRSKAEDMGLVAGAYRALLWAAATGRVDGIVGSPPGRVDLVQKMMWLMTVAKAPRSHHGGHPVFAMIEGKRLLDLARIGGVEKWASITTSWDMFTEVVCLEEVSESMATNLTFDPLPPSATSGGTAWTSDFKEAITRAIRQWGREPEALQMMKWVKRLDAVPGKFLEAFTDKELAMWRTHVKNNHVPYDRRCRT